MSGRRAGLARGLVLGVCLALALLLLMAGEAKAWIDDVPPTVAFAVPSEEGVPAAVQAEVADAQSGPARGEVRMRRLGTECWVALPSTLRASGAPGVYHLVGIVPGELDPGTYVFRADVADVAGNTASTTLRADGREMAIRSSAPHSGSGDSIAPSPLPSAPARAKRRPRTRTRLFARLGWRRRRGARLTVSFRAAATLSGRLVTAAGAGVAGRSLRVVSRFSRGASARRRVDAIATGPHGGFRLALPAGPSRRIAVSYRGGPGRAASGRSGLELRVRSPLSLHAGPRRLSNGESLSLRGRVGSRGAPLPRPGKLVAIQYYETGARRWRPVAIVRSDQGGRFRAAYRFRYVTGTARIRLRAVALAEERWPYAPGASRPLTVRVSG
jgi:hypothetical protein